MVADSSDAMKRNRGRRGLDILQRIQKMSGLEVSISDMDFPEIREVDLKLIELARRKFPAIEFVEGDFGDRSESDVVFDRKYLGVAAALLGALAAGVIDEDTAHELGGDAEEVGAVDQEGHRRVEG